MRSAQAWKLYIPLHKGKPDAMFMAHGNYEDLKRRLVQYVAGKGNQTAAVATLLSDRGRAWAWRNKRLHRDLMDRIQRSTGFTDLGAAVKHMGEALDKEPGNAQLASQIDAAHKSVNEYGDAVLALHTMVYSVIELASPPNRAQIAAVVARVHRAVAGVRAAVKR